MCAAIVAGFMVGCMAPEKTNVEVPGKADEEIPLSGVAALTSNPAIAGVAGCWRVVEGDQAGSMTLQQTGSSLRGFLDWEKKDDALITGTAGAGRIDLVAEAFKAGSKSAFTVAVSGDGRVLKGVYPSKIEMRWTPCVAGCWSLNQDGLKGMLTLASNKEGVLTGFMDWTGHADATVTGTSSDRKMEMRFSYLGDKKGVTGIYKFTLSPDGMRTLEGSTYDEAVPGVVVPVSGASVACKDISGCFTIHQVNKDNNTYTGLMTLNHGGDALSGSMDWSNHSDGVFEGSLKERRLFLDISYPGTPSEGTVGYYSFIIDPSGDYLNGSTASNSGDQATLVGSRALCPAR